MIKNCLSGIDCTYNIGLYSFPKKLSDLSNKQKVIALFAASAFAVFTHIATFLLLSI